MSLTIDNLKEQLKKLLNVREQYAQAFQQTVGQISLLQEQIKMLAIADAVTKEKAKAIEEAKRLEAENEAKKQADLVDMDIAKLDHDIKLDEGVLQNEG